jgi:hypothetical protein
MLFDKEQRCKTQLAWEFRQEDSNFANKAGGIMERSEIAEMFCVATYSGNVPALFEGFVSEQTTWAVVSGTSQSDSEWYFLGILGLHRLVGFCRESLKIVSGEMTGCVVKGDCLFAFGTFRLLSAVEKSSAETSFAVNLVWRSSQIVSARLRIMWPFPTDLDTS